MGGSKKGIYGALVGAIAGVIFLPPVGIIFAPIAGAFIGEMFTGRGTRSALRSALGSLAGYLVTIVMKFAVASMMAYYFSRIYNHTNLKGKSMQEEGEIIK